MPLGIPNRYVGPMALRNQLRQVLQQPGEPSYTGPQFASAGAVYADSTSTTASIAVPSGVAAGDIVLVFLYVNNAQAVTPTTGFTEAPDSPVVVTGGQDHNLHVYWKRATGADSGTYGFTIAAGVVSQSGVALRYTGCIASGNPFDVTRSNTGAGGAQPILTHDVSDTTTGPNRLLVWSADAGNGGNCAPPTGFTERVDKFGVVGGIGLDVSDKPQTVAGSTGTLQGTFSGGGTTSLAAWMGALLPAVSSGDFTGGSTSTDVTVSLTADGVVGSLGDANTAITVGLTASGAVGLSQTSTATAVTVGLTADGVVGTSSASTSTDVTVGLTASGSIDELHPAPPLQIPNRYVGPMALRAAFRRAQSWGSTEFVVTGLSGTSTSTDVTVGLTASGVVGVVGDASTAVTVGLTASGVVGVSQTSTPTAVTVGLTASGAVGLSQTSTATAVTVGLTAAGAVGTVGQASTALVVGLTAAGVVGITSTASTALTMGLTADGVIGLVGAADTALTVGLTADGINPANVVAASPAPFQIPNRYVGPMALRNAFRRAQQWLSQLIALIADAQSTDVTVGLTSTGVVGASQTSTSTVVTVGLTASGVVGVVGQASATAITVGLTASGGGNVSGQASTALVVGLTASGVVGKASTATTTVTMGLTAAGVVGTQTVSTSTINVGLTANGLVGTRTVATTTISLALTANGFVTSNQLTSTAAIAIVLGLTANGVVTVFTSDERTFVVPNDGRVNQPSDDRTFIAPNDGRVNQPSDDRSFNVPNDGRTGIPD